jgi:hypothetical protein
MTMLADPTTAAALSASSYYVPHRYDIEAMQNAPALDRGSRFGRRGLNVRVMGAHADWLVDTIARLNHLLTLESGWDGEQAEEISLDAAARAVDLVVRAAALSTPAPAIIPSPDGNVQIEWHLGGLDIEIVAQPRSVYEVLFEDQQTSDDWEAEGSLRSAPLHAALMRVVQRSQAHG